MINYRICSRYYYPGELTNKMSEQNLEEIIRFMSSAKQPGAVYGMKGSLGSYLLASAVKRGAPTIVKIELDSDSAAVSARDIRFFLGLNETSESTIDTRICHYPSTLTQPYSFAAFESEVWINRAAALYSLADGIKPRALTISLDSLLRRMVPRKSFGSTLLNLRVGQELEREYILEALTDAGFRRGPLVEDVGDFSVRGYIIDLFSPLYFNPIRIEQSGDTVESIRFFDPVSQRSKDSVQEIIISPVHTFIIQESTVEKGLERFVAACEHHGVEKRVRQGLMDDLRLRTRFPGAENYLSYFFETLEPLTSYFPPDATLILPDTESMSRVVEETWEEIEQGYKNALESGLPAPHPHDLYLSADELMQQLNRFRRIVFGELEIGEASEETFRVDCFSNADIRPTLVKSQAFDTAMANLVRKFSSWREAGCSVSLISHTQGQATRLLKLLEPYHVGLDLGGDKFALPDGASGSGPSISLYVGDLSSGFRAERSGLVFLTEEEIFGARVRASSKKRARGLFVSSLDDLSEGESVVHEDYGIGIFRGLLKKEFDGVASEVMVIEYAGGDLLYHPVERLQSIQKYVSGSDIAPRIDRLGGKGWEKTKARIKKSIKEMAKDLLEIYAKRQTAVRPPYGRIDDDFAAFEASFEFEETADQAKAIQDVMESLDSDRPMDRLVCGDVGYGKTEVAIRAAFRVVMDGKQAAVLVPTTVLAQQHYETFCKRFKGYPIVVEALSRFRNAAEQKEIVEKLAAGKIDLVVGTHRLLQKDVHFKDLGLLVLDEEQRFGVAHKERIKKFRAHIDVLTLTATPIPRTLNLSLSGIRDLSIIETPPANRRSIRTHVLRQSDEAVKEAIGRELGRGGQVFYLHNRVQTIYQRAASLQRLVPEARIGVAHGQMGDGELEQVMLDFIAGNLNTLVCTSIIESGLDIPRANTIVIERADTLGLADLYQLKGRVGRSHVRAYAYLLTPPETLMTADAVKRLAVIQEHTELGQGFRVAMRDMEIRGAGNILGTSQSGHVGQVGYEMYLDLLEDAVREMKGEPQEEKIDPEIHLKIEALIPDDYVPDPKQRMNLYKKLSKASNQNDIDETEDEIIDLYGKQPLEVVQLISLMRIRFQMKELGLLKLDYAPRELMFSFAPEPKIDPARFIQFVQDDPRMRLIPGDRFGYKLTNDEIDQRIDVCFKILGRLKGIMETEDGPTGYAMKNSPEKRFVIRRG